MGCEVDTLLCMASNRPSRSEVHRLFVEKFGRQWPRTPVTVDRIGEVEKELGIVLPRAYCEFLCRYGCVGCSIEVPYRREEEYHPTLEGFFVFGQVVEVVRAGWNTIIPAGVMGTGSDIEADVFEYFVPFADAECGNYFLFRRTSAAAEDSPVYLFDHEIAPNVAAVAGSFDELLWWYVENARGDDAKG